MYLKSYHLLALAGVAAAALVVVHPRQEHEDTKDLYLCSNPNFNHDCKGCACERLTDVVTMGGYGGPPCCMICSFRFAVVFLATAVFISCFGLGFPCSMYIYVCIRIAHLANWLNLRDKQIPCLKTCVSAIPRAYRLLALIRSGTARCSSKCTARLVLSLTFCSLRSSPTLDSRVFSRSLARFS